MTRNLTYTMLAFAFAASVCVGQAQRSKGKGGPLSIQGDAIPDLTIFDESGKEISLKEALNGRYGVIVFGCLT